MYAARSIDADDAMNRAAMYARASVCVIVPKPPSASLASDSGGTPWKIDGWRRSRDLGYMGVYGYTV